MLWTHIQSQKRWVIHAVNRVPYITQFMLCFRGFKNASMGVHKGIRSSVSKLASIF